MRTYLFFFTDIVIEWPRTKEEIVYLLIYVKKNYNFPGLLLEKSVSLYQTF